MSSKLSKSLRSLHRRIGLVVVGGCALVGVLGCRNNQAQTDLIQREMRQQEDQIYALQDYLCEYQQLLCDARSENEALRKQLVRDQYREEMPAKPRSLKTAPSAPEPEIKINDQIDEDIDMTLPEAPPLDADTPEPPPLEPTTPAPPPLETSSLEETGANPIAADERSETAEPDEFVSRVGSEAIVVDAVSYEEPSASEVFDYAELVAGVVLRAEVSLGDRANGPRVLVDVLPVTCEREPVEYEGALSLMFMKLDEDGKRSELARWDFSADELADFAHDMSRGTAYVFPLQLPTHVASNEPVEFWVRLTPTDGEKILTHALLDLSRPGRFVYDELPRPARHAKLAKGDREVRVAAIEVRSRTNVEPIVEPTSQAGTVSNVDGWRIARPGDVRPITDLAAESRGAWRTATQPIPMVESQPVQPDPLATYESDDRNRDAFPETASRDVPQWLPERPGSGSLPDEQILSAPEWSANR